MSALILLAVVIAVTAALVAPARRRLIRDLARWESAQRSLFTEQFAEMTRQMEAVSVAIGSQLLPALASVAKALAQWAADA